MIQKSGQGLLRTVLISSDPIILVGCTEGQTTLGPAPIISPPLKERSLWILLKVHYSLEATTFRSQVVADYKRHAQLYPKHRIFFLCNTPAELFLLQQCNVPSIVCNHNIFVSERIFDIQADQRKRFDAIYNARPSPYKRHELCSEVPRTALLYYAPNPEDHAYLAELRKTLPNATFVNELEASSLVTGLTNSKARAFVIETFTKNNYVALVPDVVARYCNRAQVGLCLSASEGAMYASMEYLFCGLPVVSTENRGGRDFYFDPEFCTTVPPDANAVAQAVDDLIRRNISPGYIRQKTLCRVTHDRNSFLQFVQSIYEHEGATRAARDDWEHVFVHTMSGYIGLDSLLENINT
jgi:glycosyltransferase involved in cell wall biosynthesis